MNWNEMIVKTTKRIFRRGKKHFYGGWFSQKKVFFLNSTSSVIKGQIIENSQLCHIFVNLRCGYMHYIVSLDYLVKRASLVGSGLLNMLPISALPLQIVVSLNSLYGACISGVTSLIVTS